MSHPVIPAPVRFDGGAGRFAFRPDTLVAYADPGVAPVAERFCSEITRRSGLRLAPSSFPAASSILRHGRPGPGRPATGARRSPERRVISEQNRSATGATPGSA